VTGPALAVGTHGRVSVIIPFRNDVATIGKAVRSVANQSWRDLEILLCDDRSGDGSGAAATEALALYPNVCARILHADKPGVAAARNAGIDAASGEFIAFLDADDFWEVAKLERCVSLLRSTGATIVCHAEHWLGVDGNHRIVQYSRLMQADLTAAKSIFRLNPFSTSAVVVRTTAARSVGGFDSVLESAEDYDFWLKLSFSIGFSARFIDEPLGTYLLRKGSESSRVDARHRALLQIGRRYVSQISSSRLSRFVEHRRYNSRIFVSTGVRLFSAGDRWNGLAHVLRGLAEWPFRPEAATWLRTRLRSRDRTR
jgi:glycosyltransferase involved in cell wall biosynthesis